MFKNKVFYTLKTVPILMILACNSQSSVSNTSLSDKKEGMTVSQSGHYIEWNGKPVILIGDSVTQGWMELGENFNQEEFIDGLASRGMNLLLMWSYMGTSKNRQEDDARISYDAPEIWPWTGSPDRRDFDLTHFNQAYFNRLKELVGYAEGKGVIVLIVVHDGGVKWRFDHHPFNASLGNGPLKDRRQYVELADYKKEMPLIFDSSWSVKQKNQYFQERFCEKLITELNSYPNILYEMFNEGEWYDKALRRKHEQHFLAFFRSRTNHLLLTNTDSIKGDNPHHDSKVDVITLHVQWKEPFSVFQKSFNKNPAKPYLLSEPIPGWDGTNINLDTVRSSVWETALAGAGWVNQNDLSFGWDPQTQMASKAAIRNQAYDYAGYCASFINNYVGNLSKMRPISSISSTGICMANEGLEYVIYAPLGRSFTVDLSSSAEGQIFSGRWYNPRTGEFSPEFHIAGGSLEAFKSPDDNDWILHIF